MTHPWETSAQYCSSLMKETQRLGVGAQALARCSPLTRAIFENPWSARWHPGSALSEFSGHLAQEVGEERFAELNYALTRSSFGPILHVIQIALAVSGRSPATVFARVGGGIESALRGVGVTWVPTSKKAGRIRFEYHSPIGVETEWAWRGALRALGGLAGGTLTFEQAVVDLEQGVLDFSMSW